MSILHLLNKTIIISRLTTVSGYKQAYSTVTGSVGNLQPLADSKSNLYDGKAGKHYVLFTDPELDIDENDMVRDVGTGKLYKVRQGGVSRRTQGSIDYNRVILEEIT